MSSLAVTSKFIQGLENDPENEINKGRGENGHVQLTEQGFVREDADKQLLYLFDKSVRDIQKDQLERLIDSVLEYKDNVTIKKLFLLMFQTRACRGGKGEKEIFYDMFLKLWRVEQKTCIALLPLIPFYGYWKDLFQIVKRMDQKYDNKDLLLAVKELIVFQMRNDFANDKGSLLWKFFPRENKEFAGGKGWKWPSKLKWKDVSDSSKFPKKSYNQKCLRFLWESVLADVNQNPKNFRKTLNSFVKKMGGTAENLMSEKKWNEIEADKIPSLCALRNRKAFFNEKVKMVPLPHEEETGNRTNDPDRIDLRKRMIEEAIKGGLKGKMLQPHEIVQKIGHYLSNLSSTDKKLLNAQWEKIKEYTLELVKEYADKEKKLDISNTFPLVDVSGSMAGTPMEVAIGLGIMLSEITNQAFRDTVITFETTPKVFSLKKCKNIVEKVLHLRQAPWGGSTNLYKALEIVLKTCVENNLKKEDVPTLVVFSDMQIDQADNNFQKGYLWKNMNQKFKDAGYDGTPNIVFWNLRACPGMPVEADQEGACLLNGYSSSLMKCFLTGQLEEEVVDEKTGEVKKKRLSPLEIFNNLLEDKLLDKVRIILDKLYAEESEVKEWEVVESS